MKFKLRLGLLLPSILLLSLGWVSWGQGWMVLIAIVPLMLLRDDLVDRKASFWTALGWSYIIFLGWNLCTTWWLINATLPGMIMANVLNALFYALLFATMTKFAMFSNKRAANLTWVLFWLGFEYFYLNAEISWTWLNLGNALAPHVQIIQWFEYTGILGGTLWILLCNMAFYQLLVALRQGAQKHKISAFMVCLLIIFGPILVSINMYHNYEEKQDPIQILSVQPNVDPYNKFDQTTEELAEDLVAQILPEMNEDIDLVVCPETAIPSYTIMDGMERHDEHIQKLREVPNKYSATTIFVGFMLKQNYKKNESHPSTAQKYRHHNMYFQIYNSAVRIDTNEYLNVYHKSKHVVGVESMPYPKLFKLLENVMIDLGGTTGSLGMQDTRTNLAARNGEAKVAPIICWENVFGEFVTGFVQNGANMMVVMTNEGWWGNTQAHIQLNHLSRARAIETRRSIVRSANTGVSSFINQRGDIEQSLGWWKKGALNGRVNLNEDLTFYVKYGDYLGRSALFLSIIFLIYWLVQSRIRRFKSN